MAPRVEPEVAVAAPEADAGPPEFDDTCPGPAPIGIEPRLVLSGRDDAEGPWHVAYGALDLARLVSGAPLGALFACQAGELRLLAARSVAQAHLDVIRGAWADPRGELTRGHPYAHRHPSLVALPCMDGSAIVGVLLLAWEIGDVPAASALTSLSRVLGASLRRLGVTGGVAPRGSAAVTQGPAFVRDTHALALHVLLEEHEWNVSRVARVLEVTRMTVYNRMHAAGIERVRLRKSRRRRARRAPADAAQRAGSEPTSARPESLQA